MTFTPYHVDDLVTVYGGDCLDVLRELPDNSVDAVVTDPPYGLEFMGREWDSPWKRGDRIVADAGLAQTGYSDGGNRLPRPTFTGSTNPRCFTCGGTRRGRRDGTALTKVCLCADGGRFPNVRAEEMRVFGEWCQQWATECLRVLKPGGHLLAFGGTRTVHRLTCGIEDAGFEIRDGIDWIYASGFPKSLDVSKAIDRRAEENVETNRRIAAVAEVIRTHREAKGLDRAAVSLAVVGTPSGACWNWEHHQLPSVEMWPAIKATLDIPDHFDGLVEGDRAQFIAAERAVIEERTAIQGGGASLQIRMGERREVRADITAPATDDARRWQGWGTALKPAHEPIVVARKPLAGTVASNVTTWGTGALNIDACRVAMTDADREIVDKRSGSDDGLREGIYQDGVGRRPAGQRFTSAAAGRWPSNVVLSHTPWCEVCECGARGPHETSDHCYDTQLDCVPGCPVAELDRQSGVSTSPPVGSVARTSGGQTIGTFAYEGRPPSPNGHGDSGGPSRFFPVFRYEAKAPTSERPRVGQKGAGEGRGYSSGLSDRVRQCRACGNRTIRSGETQPGCGHNDFEFVATAAREEHTAHPTVKPLDLMRWLVRLVCPPTVSYVHCVSCGYDSDPLRRVWATVPAKTERTDPLLPGVPTETSGASAETRATTVPDLRQENHRSDPDVLLDPLSGGGPEAADADVHRMWDDVLGTPGSQVLLQGMRGPSDEAGAEDLRVVPDGVSAEDTGPVLFAGMRGESNRDGEKEGTTSDAEGLRPSLRPRTSDGDADGIHPRAPQGDGSALGADAEPQRGRAPQERDQGRQQDRESGSPTEIGTRPDPETATAADHMSALPRADQGVGSCPSCGANLRRTERPGVTLDPFAGSGTTAEACVLEWFHCIAIERDETYLPLIRQRITKPLQPGLPGMTEDPAAPVRPVTRPKPARVEPTEPPAEQPDLFTLSE